MNSKKETLGPFIPIPFKLLNIGPYKIFRVLRLSDDKLAVISTDDKQLQARVDVVTFKEENGQIISYEFSPETSSSCSFGEGNFIDDAKPYPDGLILLIRNEEGAKALCHWKLGEQLPNTIDLNGVSCFSVNYTTNTVDPKIAVASGKELNVIVNADPEQVVYHNTLEEEIYSIALNDPYVFVVCPNSLKLINIQPDGQVKSLKMKCTQNSYCLVSSFSKFLLFNGQTVLQVVADLSHDAQETFDQPPQRNYKLATYYLSTGIVKDNRVTAYIYDFKHQMFVTTLENIVAATCAGKYNFIATEHDLYYLYNISQAVELIKGGTPLKAFQYLPKQNPENSLLAIDSSLPQEKLTSAAYVAIFEYLYFYQQKKNEYIYRSKALNLLSLPQYQTCLIDALMVFGCFHFYSFENDGEQNIIYEIGVDYTSTGLKDSSKESIVALLEVLKRTHTNSGSKAEIYVETAKMEAMALLGNINEIKEFLKSDPKVDSMTIKQFASTLDDKVMRFIIYAIYNDKENAMLTFREISNPSNDVLEYVVQLMKHNAGDWQFIEEYGISFINADPIRGIEILTDPKIDYSKALNYVQSNFTNLETLFLLGAVHHPHAVAKRQVINQLSDKLCNSLIEISKPDFDINEVSYLKCVIKNGESTPVKDMKEEIASYLQDLVSSFPNELDTETLIKHIQEFSAPLQISIYLSASKYKEALDIIWESNNGDPDKAALSCRECSNPVKAFELLIQKMKDQLEDSKFLPELTKLLSKNIDIIDVSYALGFLDSDASLDTTLTFVEQLYRSLLTSRRDAEFDKANSEAEAFEAKYRRYRAQSGYVDLDNEKKCHGCGKPLGFSYVVRTPTGLLYHLNCLPESEKPKF